MKTLRTFRHSTFGAGALALSLLIATLPGTKANVIVRGDPNNQISAADVADVETLAAQVMPNNRLALIECVPPPSASRSGEVTKLTVYSEPIEQTPRVWRGYKFTCMLQADYHPPTLSTAADERYRKELTTVRTCGRWLVARANPVQQYAVITSAGIFLPPFSAGQLDQFRPASIGRDTNSDEAAAAYDLVLQTIAPARSGPFEVEDIPQLPVSFVTVSAKRIEIHFGGPKSRVARITLRKMAENWRITSFYRW